MNNSKSITVIIPAYNEENNLLPMISALSKVLGSSEIRKHFNDYVLLFIDDGSKDKTLETLKEQSIQNKHCKYISFSRNFGHQYAVKAGLDHANSDIVIVMDCDMQHPPTMLPTLIKAYQEENYDVVYTLRQDDKSLSWLKRLSSKTYYGILNMISTTKVEKGAADFYLLSKKVVDYFKELNEQPLFLRGLRSWIGFRQKGVTYIPAKRFSGVSKYTLKKMLYFAFMGIGAFSTKPLEFIVKLGVLVSGFSFIYLFYAIFMSVVGITPITGWTSLICTILILGGLQLITIGIVALYIGNIFMAMKGRPLYVIKEKII